MWRSLLLVLGLNIVCLTQAVVQDYLNKSVNPCDNFYQYACGNWLTVNNDIEHGDTLSLLDANMNRKIAEFLESNGETNSSLQKMKTFYRTCKSTRDYRVDRFLDQVKLKSGWAIDEDSWKPQLFDWLDTIAEMRKYGAQIVLEQTVMPKWDEPHVNIIYLDVVKIHPSDKTGIINTLKQTSMDKSTTDSLADELVQFERQLSQITLSKPESDENDGEVVMGFLNEALPFVNWVKYLSIVFGKEVPLTTRVIVHNTEIMSRLAKFLNGSKPSLICHYVMVKFLQFLDEYSINESSSNECITTLHQSMPLGVDYVIENNFYSRDYDQVIHILFRNLKVSFLGVIQELYPNQNNILKFARSKISSMHLQVGNARRDLTANEVDRYYKGLQLSGDFYENLLKAFKWKVKKELKSLDGSRLQLAYQWTITPSPFFLQPKNRIVVPLSLLQDSIMSKIKAGRSAILGFILGHELLHAFDQIGMNYDYQGSMVDSPLSVSSTFLERIECLERHLIGMNTGEKIADLGGIRLAYSGYRRHLLRSAINLGSKNEEGWPRGQAFFIDFAQFFCGVDKKETKIHDSNHGTNELRVLQALKHFDDFSYEFRCPVGSGMNPELKCRVW